MDNKNIEIGDTVLITFVGEVNIRDVRMIGITFKNSVGQTCHAMQEAKKVVLIKKTVKNYKLFQYVHKIEGRNELCISAPMTEEFKEKNHSNMMVVSKFEYQG